MIRSFIVGVCIAAIALVPIAGRAQEPPPPPPPGYAPPPPPPPQYPPPQYQQPPPPQYYQPPPPQYYAPPPRYYVQPQFRPPSSGVGAIIVGAIFLGVGLIFVGVSIPLWGDACGVGHSCLNQPFDGSNDYANASGALALDIVGGALFTVGAIVLPVGIVQNARFNKWRSGQHVKLTPSATGLKLTF